jgi:PAS domain S-box-containing protein
MESRAPVKSVPDIQLFRDVFDASPIGIAVENLDGQPLFVNPALCSMLGFSEEEMRSKHCVQFSPPQDSQKDWALFEQLRAGSINHYQLDKRYFRRDGSLVWGRLSLSLLNHRPSPLVIALVENITEQKKAEEARFRDAAIIQSSEDAIASGTLDGMIVSWNAGAQRMYGYTEAEVIGKPITILVPPELPDEENKILEILKAGGCIDHFETNRVTKSGKRISVSLSISPIKDSSGRIVGVAGIARDITECKRAQVALGDMARRLIEAQEQERARIGRELHDDINQRLAMVAMELEQPLNPSEFQNRVQGFRRELRRISDDVQALSRDLHSTKLKYLGAIPGMKSWCNEFAERQKIEVEFKDDVQSALPLDIGLPLFRVLQEGLHNAFKHSGVRRMKVLVREDSGQLHLIIADSGRGFDVEAAMQGKGLGLTSMRERIRLVKGTVAIESKPMAGTTIHVRVPLGSNSHSVQAAS